MTVIHDLKTNRSTIPLSDDARFEAAFQQFWPRIHRVVFHLVGDPDEAEDITLEAFLRLHKRPRLLREGQNPGGWLYRVATNLGYNALRARSRRHKYEQTAGRRSWENKSSPDPAAEAERKEAQRQVRQVMTEIKPRSAKLLILRHAGLSYAELAEALGVAPGSIGTLLARAEREFERQYRAMYPAP